ncbi:30S ribosomal protein S20 [Patescibacteria group bacterium]|nr:30S ribosomal protein S20 [Patescibacteria group bacterium]
MPIKKSAIKALRQSNKRQIRNKKRKATIKWTQKKFLKLVLAKNTKKASELYLKLQKEIDKAIQKGTLKKNTGARKKSRLYKKLKELTIKK